MLFAVSLTHTHKLYRIFDLFYLSYILFLTGVTVIVSNDNGSLFFFLISSDHRFLYEY